MTSMNKTKCTAIKAMSMDGSSSYLMTYSDTIAGVKQEIDDANKIAMKLGYKAEQFLIVGIETYVYRSDDGAFVKRETYENAIEVYPAQI